ncbi:hypothetical protein TYRP_022218 [Tyrophagus putrescentiae]|nr:hypothetical protein TYRP_022218 [Tyrophagus putrescentiae]
MAPPLHSVIGRAFTSVYQAVTPHYDLLLLEALHETLGFLCVVDVFLLLANYHIWSEGVNSPTVRVICYLVEFIISLIFIKHLLWTKLRQVAAEDGWKPKPKPKKEKKNGDKDKDNGDDNNFTYNYNNNNNTVTIISTTMNSDTITLEIADNLNEDHRPGDLEAAENSRLEEEKEDITNDDEDEEQEGANTTATSSSSAENENPDEDQSSYASLTWAACLELLLTGRLVGRMFRQQLFQLPNYRAHLGQTLWTAVYLLLIGAHFTGWCLAHLGAIRTPSLALLTLGVKLSGCALFLAVTLLRVPHLAKGALELLLSAYAFIVFSVFSCCCVSGYVADEVSNSQVSGESSDQQQLKEEGQEEDSSSSSNGGGSGDNGNGGDTSTDLHSNQDTSENQDTSGGESECQQEFESLC